MSKRVLILGGGFGGVYTALGLEKTLAGKGDVEVTLINRENSTLLLPCCTKWRLATSISRIS